MSRAQTSGGTDLSVARITLSALAENDIPAGVLTRLRTVVAARPDAPAVVDAGGGITFGDLAGRAAAVAQVLRDGPADGDAQATPVGMLCGHDAAAVATVFGVLLSGHPLLVMDPLTPVARLRDHVTQLGVGVCVADAGHHAAAVEVMAAVGGRVVRSPADVPAERAGATWVSSSPGDRLPDPAAVAVLGFTSGSTGRPKVVALDHRHLVGDAWAASTVDDCIRVGDVIAHTLPLAFAAGLNVTLAGTLAGATLALYDTRVLGIAGLAGWIERTGVTVLNASPAILRALVATGPPSRQLAGLRSLTLSGEAAHGRDVAAARRLLPPTCTIFHRLGSTETGLIAQLRLGPDDPLPAGRLSVGLPIGPTRVDLVDDDGSPVQAGQPGIIEVTRASYLATGYWHDPERTAETFGDHPDGGRSYRSNDIGRLDDAGQLVLLGRRDHSVKIRGYLVEPGEVDTVLFARPDVIEAVTVGAPRPDGMANRLVSYVVSGAERPSAAAIRAGLREVLPSHMVPEAVVFVDGLPRNDRGKIDRSALPVPPAPSGGAPPISEWENVIAQVWARALAVDEVPRDADFFELGGDSLAAEALISMVIDELGVPAAGVSSALLVEAPTVAQFARLLHRRPDRRHQTLTTLQAQGTLPPLFIIAGGGGLGVGFMPLARRLGTDRAVHALQAYALERRGIPDWSVRRIARRHLATLRRLRPHGPYYLAGHSFGGVIAFEMAQRLHRAGEEVGLLAILDSFPPEPALVPPGPALSPAGRVKDAIGLAITGLIPTPGIGQYWRFHRQSRFLAQHYRSGPYPGRTLVLVADSEDRDARSQWGPHLTGPWSITAIGGDHISMLRDPHVAALADVLSAALRDAGGDADG